MIKNYFKIAWRNILRNKVFAIINIFGLALGLCACIVIYQIVSYEYSFDRFHNDNNRIYRVIGDVTESTGDKLHFCKLPIPVANTLRTDLPSVDIVAGVIPYAAKISVTNGDNLAKNFEGRVKGTNFQSTVIAEQQYFDIFKYQCLVGNFNTSLTNPSTVVLTESRARLYFGNETLDEIIGKKIIYNDSLIVTVSGIVKDWDKNSDLLFTDFISYNTLESAFLKRNIITDSWKQANLASWVFTKLSAGSSKYQVNNQIRASIKRNAGTEIKLDAWLEPLSNLHFNADIIENPIRTAHLPTLYGLTAIAFFILLLALVNFINLSTAQSIHRAKEIGIRKVLGSNRSRLVFQFLTQSLVLTFFATLVAVAFVKPILLGLSSFIPQGVSFRFSELSTLLFLISLIVVTAGLAGFYPAKVLSSYLPSMSLKGIAAQKGGEKWLLRKGLIVFQFSVSLVFIIGCIVISQQLRYTREKDLGFKSDAVLTIETPRGAGFNKVAVFAQKLKQLPSVSKVALQWLAPMTENSRGMKLKFQNTDVKDIGVTQVAGNEDYISLYQIKLLSGRNLVQTDTVNEFVINESLVKLMGLNKNEDAIGKILYWNDKPYPVVGVVADFHTISLHDKITPLCIINRHDRESSVAIKLASSSKQSGDIKAALSNFEKAWKETYPEEVFNFRFYDESLFALYEKDQKTATLMNLAMVMAIFISCIGLFGLTLFIAQSKSKEIGIRKVLGASIPNIVLLLSKEFIVLVLIALLIATPIAMYFMNHWLQGFAYHITLSVWVFFAAGIIAVTLTLITVSFQAIKAAVANPVKSLRTE